jgi:hypothetical protein
MLKLYLTHHELGVLAVEKPMDLAKQLKVSAANHRLNNQ